MAKRYYIIACFFIAGYFTKVKAADYYWVGGSGQWSQISHWATTSGGSVTYAQSPTSNDNVIFDVNSFPGTGQTVIIDDDNVFCRNITIRTITNNPQFTGSADSRLNVFGSLDIAENCVWNYNGRIFFRGNSAGMTINLTNKKAGDQVTFMGSGSWSLNSQLIVESVINIVSGTISFNDNRVECKFLRSPGTDNRTISFNNSNWLIKGQTNIIDEFWDESPRNIWSVTINASNLTTTSDSAKIEFNTPKSDTYINGNGRLDLPGLLFSSNTGRSLFKNLNNSVIVNIKGDVECNHNLFFNSALSLKNLILKPGVNIGLLSGATFKINGLSGDGTCGKYITLLSFPHNNLVNLESATNINVGYYQINNIRLTGTGTANNSIKLGSTTGWTINEKTSQNFYWIGRNGNWADANSWSFTSGGPAAGCVPSAVDNVFFDNNSFNAGSQFVTVNAEDVYCKDMKWLNISSNSGIQGAIDKRIQVYGSLEFSSNMVHNYEGEYLFLGSGDNTITSKGKIFTHDIYFNNVQGSWTLKDNFECERRIFFVSGKIIFDNIAATLNRLISDQNVQRQLEFKNSLIKFIVNHNWYPYVSLMAENLIVIPGGSEIIFSTNYGGFNVLGNNNVKFNKITFDGAKGNFTNYSSSPNAIVEASHVNFRGSSYINLKANLDTLTLSHGSDYEFSGGTVINIKKLLTLDECKGFVSMWMSPYQSGSAISKLNITNSDSYSKFAIKDIHVSANGPVNLMNSIDRGGNKGWVFNGSTAGRTLYFTGTTQNWNDVQNWSLTSGGVGGQCLPTEIDNVIFDNNSKLTTHNWISSGPDNVTCFCKDFIYNADNFTGQFSIGDFYVFGDFQINKLIKNFNTWVFFSGHKDTIQQVYTHPEFKFWGVQKRNNSTLSLASPIYVIYDFSFIEGIFNTNNYPVILNENLFVGKYSEIDKPILNPGTSKITINGQADQNRASFEILNFAVINGINSEIELTNPSTGLGSYSTNIKLGKIISTAITGKASFRISNPDFTIRNLTIRGDGEFRYQLYPNNPIGKLTTDTLIFSAGKSYVFQNVSETQVNKYFQSRGNNCQSISFTSDINGSKAKLVMPSAAKINMDFTQLRDIQASGGADFNAGPYSTNIANSNTGWRFPLPNPVGEVGFLGPDKILCPGQNSITLDANSFTPTETYRWSDGSTASQINVMTSGLFHVTVTFGASCITTDTIRISTASDIKDFLPNDTSLCNSSQFLLTSKIIDPDLKYLWNTGSKTENIIIDSSGKYKLSLQNENCTFIDSVNITFVRVNDLNLPSNANICTGDSLILNASGDYDRWQWQNGNNSNSITAKTAGLYWVEISKGPCIIRDSSNVTVTPRPIFNLGRDTSFCEGNTMTLSAGSPDIVRWSDGSSANTLQVNSSGTYYAVKGQTGCTFSDSIQVTVHPLPLVNLGNDITLCNSESATLRIADPDLRLLWSNGSSDPEINVSSAGSYHVRATDRNNCQKSDTINITAITVNKPNLGRDTSFCAGNTVTLRFTPQQNTSVNWSTGANTNNINVNTGGTYWVEISRDICKQRDSVNIQILPLPIVTSPIRYNICDQASTTVTVQGIFDNIQWNDGQTGSSIQIDKAGRFPFRISKGVCIADTAVFVNLVPIPDPALDDVAELCQGDRLTLSAPTFTGNILWSNGETGKIINVRNGGKYKLTLSQSGCSRADSINVTLINCSGDVLHFPNIFSPVTTSIENQFFKAIVDENFEITSFDLRIYDRNGSQVFSTYDINDQWEGKMNNIDLLSGVYTYLCKVSATGKKNVQDKIITGAVNLVR